MAAIQKSSFHVRSISLPSTSHPLVVSVEDHLCKLRATVATSSASSVCHTLDNLRNLYESVDDMMQLPITKQSLSQEANRKWADEVLNGSLRLLEVCSISKDVLLQTKESVQDLKSSLRRRRRRRGADLVNDAKAYLVSRKMINKNVYKYIRNFEKTSSLILLEKDDNLVSIVNMLREAEALGFSTLKSLLCYISGPHAKSKNSWSLVSKIMQPKQESSKTEISDLERLNHLIGSVNKQKLNEDPDLMQTVMKQLETLDLDMQELENGIESIYRCLLKTRVSILNLLNE